MTTKQAATSRLIRLVAICLALACTTAATPIIVAQDLPGQRPSNARTATNRGDLDNQLLEGLGGGSARGGTIPAAAKQGGRPDDRSNQTIGPENVIDPFAEGADVGEQNPLARVGRQMRFVQKRLTQRQVADTTQQAQRQIVADLDQLIASLAAAQQSQSRSKASASSQGEQRTARAAKTGKEAARGGGDDQEQASGTALPLAAQGVVNEIWGHLPERLRRQMRSAEAPEFLPQYRKLIEDYYKRLAESRGIQP